MTRHDHAEKLSTSRTDRSSLLLGTVPALGLALAVYLTWSSWSTTGCPTRGCVVVLTSPYNTLGGIPVGLYAAVLWIGVLSFRRAVVQWFLRSILAAGGLFFLLVQTFVIEGFCAFCALHSLLAIVGAITPHIRPRPTISIGTMGIAGLTIISTGDWNRLDPTGSNSARSPEELDHNPALYWFGPKTAESPWLVLSFTCVYCWEKLEEMLDLNRSEIAKPPGFIFLTDARNRALSERILAGILSSSEPPAQTLSWFVELPEAHRWQMLRGQTGFLTPILDESYPNFRYFLPEAARILDDHLDFIEETEVPMTPFLLTSDARLNRFSIRDAVGRHPE